MTEQLTAQEQEAKYMILKNHLLDAGFNPYDIQIYKGSSGRISFTITRSFSEEEFNEKVKKLSSAVNVFPAWTHGQSRSETRFITYKSTQNAVFELKE